MMLSQIALMAMLGHMLWMFGITLATLCVVLRPFNQVNVNKFLIGVLLFAAGNAIVAWSEILEFL